MKKNPSSSIWGSTSSKANRALQFRQVHIGASVGILEESKRMQYLTDDSHRVMQRGDEISDCDIYRYWLRREWDRTRPTLAFLMLNPSRADHLADNPAIARCMARAGTIQPGQIPPCPDPPAKHLRNWLRSVTLPHACGEIPTSTSIGPSRPHQPAPVAAALVRPAGRQHPDQRRADAACVAELRRLIGVALSESVIVFGSVLNSNAPLLRLSVPCRGRRQGLEHRRSSLQGREALL
jgi:hypothetical protein